MPSSRLAKVVAAIALAPLVTEAHMIMANPKPFGNPSKSPLDPSGSNFPCQSVAYTGASNAWAAGSTQTLSFQEGDTAVHGGGSCQISVTTDKNPTKSSKWKVIHSIEGGCPANVKGNLVAPQVPGTFPFTVPNSLPNGEMAMAWTWFNTVGNREMYMNCAPITVTGSTGTQSTFDALPDMAVANINAGSGATCHTSENFDYIFANPGQSVVNGDALKLWPAANLCGGAASAPASGSPASGASSAAPAAPAASSAAPAAPVSTMKTVPASGAPTGVPAKDPPPTQPKQSMSASAPAAAQPTGNTSSPGSPTTGECKVNGAVVCQGTDMFAICDRGQAYFMPVAAGTTCNNGVISKRSSHMHRHLRRSLF